MMLQLLNVLLVLVPVVASVQYIDDEFVIDKTMGAFNHLAVHKATGQLYIGAVNRIYSLDKNLDIIQEAVTGKELDNPDCTERFTRCTLEQKEMNSYNKALVIDYQNNKLIACSTLYQGVCDKYDLDNIKLRDENRIHLAIVANNATATTFVFIAPGPIPDSNGHQGNALYVGASYTNTGSQSARDRVPAFTSRNINDFKYSIDEFPFKTSINFDTQLRQSFPVYYQYGFGSEDFSYMITVQKINPSSEAYISKMFRVCQKDKKFYSYAEVQLQCISNNTHFNLAQAAYLGKAGNKLARSMGIPDTEDVLYVVFSTSTTNTAIPNKDSALCVYPMRTVSRKFTENIKDCFKGIGNTGPAHIRMSATCTKTPELVLDDKYCGQYEVNTPIDGSMPIKTNAAATFNYTVSAVTVTQVSEYTVAIVGMTNGHLVKVALEKEEVGTVYEDVALTEGSKIHADMYVDSDGQHVYAMTDWKLLKVKLYECSQYSNCSSCLAANDPFCGWCSLENKCSLRDHCEKSNENLRWLSYSSQSCVTITRVEPEKIQKEKLKTTKLQLHVDNLPYFTGSYQCVFRGYGDTLRTTNTTVVQQTNIMCETPTPHLLPPIPTGEDHIVMDLAIQINNMDFVVTKFTFFDCHVHTGCTDCSLSAYPCTWCIQNHMCTHNPIHDCKNNELVYNNLESTEISPKGPKMCPRIELQSNRADGKIFVPAGISKKIFIKALHLRDFQKENIRCLFSISGNREVGATVTASSDDEAVIECDSVDFSYGQNTSSMNVPFYIYWKSDKQLDNPSRIQVIMYKCDALASTCGDCVSMSQDYQCGWCSKNIPQSCSINTQCKLGGWLPYEATCPNVEIASISPQTGPKQGGTKLTIIGKNLGTKFEDVEGGVTVAGVACNPIKELYQKPSKIVCETGSYDTIQTGTVRVLIGRKFSAEAVQKFTYVEPQMDTISPRKGPMSGGTKVTITGRHLDAGTTVVVMIGSNTCDIIGERRTTSLVCITSAADDKSNETISAHFDLEMVSSRLIFWYTKDPVIESVAPLRAIVSGGITITVKGSGLATVQNASMITMSLDTRRRRRSLQEFKSKCLIAKDSDILMLCYSPKFPNTTVDSDNMHGVKFGYAFQLDNVRIDRTVNNPQDMFTVFPDPIFHEFKGNKEKSYQSKTDNYLTINGENLNLGFNTSDVKVKVGKAFCNVTSIDTHGKQLNCKPPQVQPNPENHRYPEVIVQVGRNLTQLVGYLKYEQPEILSTPVIIGLGVGGGVVILMVIVFGVLWCVKTRENTNMKKKWQIQMDNLEVKVAKECKEAFAELQTDMNELTNDHFGQVAIPFWDYRTYCMRVLFPKDEDHPVIKDLEVEYSKREQIEQGLKLFSQLIGNKTFLLIFVRTLEANKKFSMRDRVNVASLISVALQTRMEYATEILKTLLAELIEKSVEGKNHPKLLLRRTESVAEKMLTNWYTFLLYKFLRECAGEPLFMLYQAIKQQTSKGPVDMVTSEARYSLSEDKLIRQQVDYKPLTIYVKDLDSHINGQQSQSVKVLDCDTITQVKEKILDAIYKNAPFSSRPTKQNIDLVLSSETSNVHKLVMADIDNTSKQEGDYKRLNNLNHYQVPDGAFMALVSKQQTPSIYDLSVNEKSPNPKSFDYKRLGNNKDEYSTLLYNSRSPSLNRTASPHQVLLDIENNTNNSTKHFHLVKQHDQESSKDSGDRGSKMMTEIYLTRLLATKGTLQQFVDDLFERIFSTVHRGTSLPLAIKYMFDFLDDQALLHNIQDPDVVHTWKSNSLPLRFWVNVIKNPNFVFDIYKSNIVDSCLSVVAQNFMDSCSMSEHKLGKDSPSSKLLYAKDIPTYKKWVDRYNQDIKMMPAISDQDITAMMTEESRTHQDEFNTNAALYELYKYVEQYHEDLTLALDEDEFARKNKLNHKLDQVHSAMTGQMF